jgi:hypothetical protein
VFTEVCYHWVGGRAAAGVREEMRAKFKGETSEKASSLIIAPFDSKTCQDEEK